ncbi:MAG TPA: hypothetical protein VFY38_11675 [Pseudonocardia sp.]|nr:hypothetical protein [Pseudonocardia sp.]
MLGAPTELLKVLTLAFDRSAIALLDIFPAPTPLQGRQRSPTEFVCAFADLAQARGNGHEHDSS